MAGSNTPRPGKRTRDNSGGSTQHNFALHLVERGMQTVVVAPVARDEEEDKEERLCSMLRTLTMFQPGSEFRQLVEMQQALPQSQRAGRCRQYRLLIARENDCACCFCCLQTLASLPLLLLRAYHRVNTGPVCPPPPPHTHHLPDMFERILSVFEPVIRSFGGTIGVPPHGVVEDHSEGEGEGQGSPLPSSAAAVGETQPALVAPAPAQPPSSQGQPVLPTPAHPAHALPTLSAGAVEQI